MVFLNGKLVPDQEALLPASDRAILFGDAAYETLRTYNRRVFRALAHLDRLRLTLKGIGIESLPWDDAALTQGIEDLIDANNLTEARIRMTVTGGEHDGQIRLRRTNPPSIVITAVELHIPEASHYQHGVRVAASQYPIHNNSPLARLKTTARLVNLMAKEEAIENDAFDAIFLDDQGLLLEGTASNFFFLVDGTLHTASLETPILAGVTRDLVIQVAKEIGIPVLEGRFGLENLAGAEEAFITSTTTELMPVRELSPYRFRVPGKITGQLHRAYRAVVEKEIGSRPTPIPGAPA